MATQPLCLWREARLGSVTHTSPSGVSVCAEVWSAGPPHPPLLRQWVEERSSPDGPRRAPVTDGEESRFPSFHLLSGRPGHPVGPSFASCRFLSEEAPEILEALP